MPKFTRVRPFDLLEVGYAYGNISITEAIAKMQEELKVSYDCIGCKADGVPTGKILIDTTEGKRDATCPLCEGNLKTAVPYVKQYDNSYVIDPEFIVPPTPTEETEEIK